MSDDAGQERASSASPRRAPPSPERAAGRRARRWVRPAVLGTLAAVVLLTPLWGRALLRELAFFRVRRVEVLGVRFVQPREVVERLAIDTTASVWDDPGVLRARVATHPLVREVEIGRDLPGTLVVRLVEHAPVALIATATGFRAYDERGVALPIDPTAKDINAPILNRVDTALLRLLGEARLAAPAFYSRLSEVRRDGGGGSGDVSFMLDSLPVRASSDITLQRLADVEFVERDLARRRVRARELDLRFRDQVIARLP